MSFSTPVAEQYRGDGIISRAAGYGMAAIRVDGNDLLAVYEATCRAREYCVNEQKPVLIELMTYRQSHHSTSDDSTRYREISEIKSWKENDDPVNRVRQYLESKGWWSDEREQVLREREHAAVLDALQKAENKEKPHLDTMFEDVYHEIPVHLKDQEALLMEHIAKYPQSYF